MKSITSSQLLEYFSFSTFLAAAFFAFSKFKMWVIASITSHYWTMTEMEDTAFTWIAGWDQMVLCTCVLWCGSAATDWWLCIRTVRPWRGCEESVCSWGRGNGLLLAYPFGSIPTHPVRVLLGASPVLEVMLWANHECANNMLMLGIQMFCKLIGQKIFLPWVPCDIQVS